MSALATSMRGSVPLTWRVGVDNNFGWLTGPGGERHLCELHVIWFVTSAEVVCLHSGRRLTIPADGTWRWEPVAAAQACAIVGLPAPAIDGRAELDRRIDPFHIERERSALFGALVGLIRQHSLPVGHALRTLAAAQPWNGAWEGACHHGPEIFAAAVNRLTSSRDDADAGDAVLLVLDEDLHTIASDMRPYVLMEHGWPTALRALPAAIEQRAARIPYVADPVGSQLGFGI